MAGGRIVVDGRPVAFEPGDSVAVAILRAGEVPGRGGTLCLAGDCGNCLAQVDGITYVRTCQAPARPGMAVVRHPADDMPPLPVVERPDLGSTPAGVAIEVRRLEVDVAVVGGGPAGLEAEAGRASRRPNRGRPRRRRRATRSSRSMPGPRSSPGRTAGCSTSTPTRWWSRRARPSSSRSAPGTTWRASSRPAPRRRCTRRASTWVGAWRSGRHPRACRATRSTVVSSGSRVVRTAASAPS